MYFPYSRFFNRTHIGPNGGRVFLLTLALMHGRGFSTHIGPSTHAVFLKNTNNLDFFSCGINPNLSFIKYLINY